MTVYITADTHGDINRYKDVINQIKSPKEEDIIIVCGDAGLEYGSFIMGQCKKYMKKFPGTWIVMRGNHDNRYWKNHTSINDNEVIADDGWSFSDEFYEITLFQNKYPNIHYIDDTGGIYDIDGYSCLFIPGAYSVDKFYRLENNMPYEIDEQLTYKEFTSLYDKADSCKNSIDFIFTHTYPMFLENDIEYLFMANIDQSSVDKTTEKWIKTFVNNIKEGDNFKHCFFGHMHDTKNLGNHYTMLYKKVVKLEDYLNE